MADPVQLPVEIEPLVALDELPEWLQEQRWYASKSRHVAGVEAVESAVLRDDPILLLALIQARFATGTHELYQLLLAEGSFDALSDPSGRSRDRDQDRARRDDRDSAQGASTSSA